MNRIPNHLTRITMFAALLAAGVTAQPARAAGAEVRVVQLPPVVVIAKRIRIVQLENVVVTARRLAPATIAIAQRAPRIVVAPGAGRV